MHIEGLYEPFVFVFAFVSCLFYLFFLLRRDVAAALAGYKGHAVGLEDKSDDAASSPLEPPTPTEEGDKKKGFFSLKKSSPPKKK